MPEPKPSYEPRVFSASTLTGDKVVNLQGENVGRIEELMIDLDAGRLAYAVLSFRRSLGLGEKLFPVPWIALELNAEENAFILKLDQEILKKAPCFEEEEWPNMADPRWGAEIYSYYGYKPYWQ